MIHFDTLIRNATVFDGSGSAPESVDVALRGDSIEAIGPSLRVDATHVVEADGLVLAPGFIDTHTHDDLYVLASPEMQPKISQGVTTVVVGNCGISASPVSLPNGLPDPMNLLGSVEEFQFASFAEYVAAIGRAQPAVNVAALVGHTALRQNHMDRLDRAATMTEVAAMREQLSEALDHGALGLSSGLAYLSAQAATTDEVIELARPLAEHGAVYATHMRTESDGILDAMREAFEISGKSSAPAILSHLKCTGIDNWGRSGEVLQVLDERRNVQQVGCDCYPYAASSSTLDLRQVDERVRIMITWSTPHPEMAGRHLAQIAEEWSLSQVEAARQLQPAGAIYYGMSEEDVRRILQHPATMIGSDGLPRDPRPHPRLWGTFPRVLGHYCREEKLFTLADAVHKMTGMPAKRFGFAQRGLVREGYFADLTLFDPQTIQDRATFSDPIQPAAGIVSVWVNGVLSYGSETPTIGRAGRFIRRSAAGRS